MAERGRLSRRGFLAAGGAAALGVAAPALWVASRPGGLPDGPPLPEPPVLPLPMGADGWLRGDLTAAPSGDGMAYNGSAPGPLVRLREGDKVRLTFHNRLEVSSSLHLHGLPLAPAVDAPLSHVDPGGSRTQEFVVPPGAAGTHWYHPHAHGDVERQLLAGLAGAVVVTGPDEPAGMDDRLLMLTRTPQGTAVNGAIRPVVAPKAGRLRLRLLNATAGDHLLLGVLRDGARAPMHLIATDGGLIERPVELTEVLLAPGERAEVLVDATTPGRAVLTALPHSAYGPGGPTTPEVPLAAVDVPVGSAPVPLPTTLRPVPEPDLTGAPHRRLVLGGAADGSFSIDERPFDHHRVDIRARVGTTEVWEVVNAHSADHPFHLHTYPVQVLARDGVPEPFRAWRDTVNVPAGAAVTLAVPLHGATGRTVYHCHIAAHEDLGMMGVLEVSA